jgi:hypothetical protein
MARAKPKPAKTPAPTGSRRYRVFYATQHKATVPADDMFAVQDYCKANRITWNRIERVD